MALEKNGIGGGGGGFLGGRAVLEHEGLFGVDSVNGHRTRKMQRKCSKARPGVLQTRPGVLQTRPGVLPTTQGPANACPAHKQNVKHLKLPYST